MLIAISLILFLRNKVDETQQTVDNLAFASEETFFYSCLNDLAEEALFFIGMNGGYFENEIYSGGLYGPYEYLSYNGESRVLSKAEVSKNIGKYIEKYVEFCLINEENILNNFKVEVEIGEDSVIFEFDFNYQLSNNNQIKTLDKHNLKLDSKFSLFLEVVENVVENDILNPEFIDFTYIDSIENLNITVLPTLGSVIYYLLDFDNGYLFLFATQFDRSVYSGPSGGMISFDPVVVRVGENFYIELDDERNLEAVTPFFKIENNVIDFTPEEFMVGKYNIRIQDQDYGYLIGRMEMEII